MSQPFLGQIELFAFGFPPRYWAQCSGQLLPVNQNQALFALLGTTFGGDGINTFALPDLRGRVPVGQGSGQGLTPRSVGQRAGEEAHTLLVGETPGHSHAVQSIPNPVTANNTSEPGPAVALAQTTGVDRDGNPFTVNLYAPDNAPSQAMAGSAIGITGGQPHPNLMPYLVGNFCIALQGLFPSQN
jgi:microcystin-dependent protein